jgi:hypothetical protein
MGALVNTTYTPSREHPRREPDILTPKTIRPNFKHVVHQITNSPLVALGLMCVVAWSDIRLWLMGWEAALAVSRRGVPPCREHGRRRRRAGRRVAFARFLHTRADYAAQQGSNIARSTATPPPPSHAHTPIPPSRPRPPSSFSRCHTLTHCHTDTFLFSFFVLDSLYF